jgi:peptidoglycan-associated lipoprotein
MNFRPHPAGEWGSIPAVRPGGCRTVASGERFSGADLERRRARERPMKSYAVRLVAIAALASGLILADCRPTPAQAKASAPAGATQPRAPLVLVQAAPAGPAPAREQPVGLPPVKDYEPIPELRDIYFDLGTAAIRAGDMKTLKANAAWLRAHPGHLVLIEGHSDNRGATSRKNELNIDLGERRAQAAMDFLLTEGINASRITILSYGEERPQCTDESERCWSQNRRSRFLVKPR